MKAGNLNFLEPSGPLQACNGTPLPLPQYVLCYFIYNSLVIPLRGGVVVKALRYKQEGRGFDSRWRLWNNPSGCTMIQPLTEMSKGKAVP